MKGLPFLVFAKSLLLFFVVKSQTFSFLVHVSLSKKVSMSSGSLFFQLKSFTFYLRSSSGMTLSFFSCVVKYHTSSGIWQHICSSSSSHVTLSFSLLLLSSPRPSLFLFMCLSLFLFFSCVQVDDSLFFSSFLVFKWHDRANRR